MAGIAQQLHNPRASHAPSHEQHAVNPVIIARGIVDAGSHLGVPPHLVSFSTRTGIAPDRVLILGCGSSSEVGVFHKAGVTNETAAALSGEWFRIVQFETAINDSVQFIREWSDGSSGKGFDKVASVDCPNRASSGTGRVETTAGQQVALVYCLMVETASATVAGTMALLRTADYASLAFVLEPNRPAPFAGDDDVNVAVFVQVHRAEVNTRADALVE